MRVEGEHSWRMNKRSNSTHHAVVAVAGTIAYDLASAVSFTIHGAVPSLKNSRRILRNRKTNKPFSAKSSKAERWIRDAVLEVPAEYRNLRLGSINAQLRIITTLFASSYRRDVDVEVVYDALQLAGVITNDRWLREKLLYSEIDRADPRCEIVIEEIGTH